MENLTFRAGNVIYDAVIKTTNPIIVSLTYYDKNHTIEKNFFGEWFDSSAAGTLEPKVIEEIGKIVDAYIRKSKV